MQSQVRSVSCGVDFHLSKVTRGTYAGTAEMAQILLDESKHAGAWRPIRAAVALSLERRSRSAWMTVEELADWTVQAAVRGKVSSPRIKPHDAIGLSRPQLARRLRGVQRITKAEALACGHYLPGFPLPVAGPEPELLAEWFYPRFGGTERIGTWLEIQPSRVADRLRGYDVREGVRIPRAPEVWLMRALDWVSRMGPVCPYGASAAQPVWPGQSS